MNIVYETGFFIDVKNLLSAPLNVNHSLVNLPYQGNCMVFVVLWAWVVVFFFVMLIYLILCLACKNNWVLLFLWKIFINLWFGRKCSVIKLMNILAILVFTDLLYRGLTQMLPYLFFSLHFDCPIRQSPVQN